MIDIAYAPNAVEVEPGETVEFVFTNKGKLLHEAVFGDEAIQEEHEQEMVGGMSMDEGSMSMEQEGSAGHGEEGIVTLSVDPGEVASVEMSFDDGGSVLIGCHEPGHWAAGMRLAVSVV